MMQLISSYPFIIGRGEVPFVLSRIDDSAWFDEHKSAFFRSIWLVLHSLGNHIHLSLIQFNRVLFKLDAHLSLDDDEHFIGIGMVMPDKLAFDLDQFELVIVHLGNHLRCPSFREA